MKGVKLTESRSIVNYTRDNVLPERGIYLDSRTVSMTEYSSSLNLDLYGVQIREYKPSIDVSVNLKDRWSQVTK